MSYTEGQIQILRERLNAYRLNEAPAGKKALGWISVSEKINKLTRTHIPEESLRQFVRSKNKKQGQPPRKLGSVERYNAIKDFLSHDRIGYLSEHELNEEAAPYHAAFSLMTFLGCEVGSAARDAQCSLTGTFGAEIDTEMGYETIELHIDAHGEGGLIRVSEVNILEDLVQTLDRVEYSGWAVFQPDGLFIIFLNDPMTNTGHCYFSLLGTSTEDSESKVERQVLYRYRDSLNVVSTADTLHDFDAANRYMLKIQGFFPDNCIYFERRF